MTIYRCRRYSCAYPGHGTPASGCNLCRI